MALNIKNPEVHELARRIAARTGESLTDAVLEALRERMVRLGDDEALVADLLAIGRDCAGRLDARTRTVDHGELLYDEAGLPR